MSDYDKRYNAFADMVSHYTDDPREALRILDGAKDVTRRPPFVTEGYGDVGYQDEHVTEVIRRDTGPVPRHTLLARIADLEYREQRAKVQKMIEDLRAVAS